MNRSSVILICTASFAILAPVSAVLLPFYMVVKAPYYNHVFPHNVLTTISYLVVPKITKPNAVTGQQSKYFFLKTLSEIDQATLDESKFWYDTVSRIVYSETAVEANDSGQDLSSPSIEEDLIFEGAGGMGGLAQGYSNLNLAALEGGDAQLTPPPTMEIHPDANTEMWEVFGTLGDLSGALKATNLEAPSSANNLVVLTHKELVFNLVEGGAGQVAGQLWLWRCIFGLDPNNPLGPSIMNQLPDMDAAAKAAYFLDIHNVLLVKPRYKNLTAQTPKNWEHLVYDGMNCFRIDPWQNVLALQANEMEANLEGIKAGTYNYDPDSRSVQIVGLGGFLGGDDSSSGSDTDSPELGPGGGGGSPAEPEDWTQQLQVPSKPFGSQDSGMSKYSKSP
ncbi:hypothetical protein TWF281_008541 [Arthrobotrys megalospora]